METCGRKKVVGQPAPPTRDPRDVESVKRLQQRIQKLELQQLRPDSPVEEVKTEPNVNDESVDVNPFGEENPRYFNRLYQPRRNDHDVDRDDRYRDDPIHSLGLKIEILEFTGKVHPDDFIDWLSTLDNMLGYGGIMLIRGNELKGNRRTVSLIAPKTAPKATTPTTLAAGNTRERADNAPCCYKCSGLEHYAHNCSKLAFIPDDVGPIYDTDVESELDEPVVPWEDVSLDFVLALPCNHQVARLYFVEIVKLYGVPKTLTSDRDVKFVSHLCRTLWTHLGTKLHFSSSHHPQTNGQTEVVNRSLGNLLRSLIEDNAKQSDLILLQAESAYNMSVNRTTSKSPFKVVYGQNLITLLDLVLVPKVGGNGYQQKKSSKRQRFSMEFLRTTFLNGILKEEVYVGQPQGFASKQYPDHVYALDKALYGLKQAPRAWYDVLSQFLIDSGFQKVPTPMVEQAKLRLDLVEKPIDHTDYQCMIGSLIKKVVGEPSPPARDPRDVDTIERLQQRIQELELQQLRSDSLAEKVKIEPTSGKMSQWTSILLEEKNLF
uniref:RNA-directed DNA polymerase n=1 Tax=Tanacetum cinerariifolium TaxID=118510 RepID=A0A6L2KEV1_TANCI|nr:RNA-directed DNA polymerase [Tanacetum cinerariifolium]